MGVEVSEEGLAGFFEFLLPHLDERQRRLLAGATARLVGRGGITVVAEVTGMSRNTVIAGTKAFDGGEEPSDRVRAEGGGRRRVEDKDPSLLRDLQALVEADSRGDPMSPLRWTLESTRQLAAVRDHGNFALSGHSTFAVSTPWPTPDGVAGWGLGRAWVTSPRVPPSWWMSQGVGPRPLASVSGWPGLGPPVPS